MPTTLTQTRVFGDSLQYFKQLSSSRALLAAQEAPGLRIGPAKSQQQHGEGALTRAFGRNFVAASEVSDNDTQMLSRRRSAAAPAYSDGNEGPLRPSRLNWTLQTLHDRSQLPSRWVWVPRAQIASHAQRTHRQPYGSSLGRALSWQHAWLCNRQWMSATLHCSKDQCIPNYHDRQQAEVILHHAVL